MGLCRLVFAFGLLIAGTSSVQAAEKNDNQADSRPNIIVIFVDNLGYGDIEPFGSTLHRTPHLNRMAQAGRKFTHFYSASGVCTPSRAALLTGSHPMRNGMKVTDGVVLRPVSHIGLHPEEWTIAEQLRAAGYATAIFGKWHLGDQPPFLPTQQGFDFFEGIPYSDDMTPRPEQNWPPLPWMQQDQVIAAPADRDLLAQQLTRSACQWMADHKDRPFFVYFPHCMPGSTSAPFASESFKGKSKNGPFGDSVEELDWSLGEMISTLQEHQLLDNTLIVWTSDNGAPRRNPPQGSNAPLAGWGYTVQEGGMRIPCLMQWPGKIPAGTVCDQLSTTMDLLPTCAAITQTELPADRKIDGHNILPLMLGTSDTSPYRVFPYYQLDWLMAVRAGDWKLYLPQTAEEIAGVRGIHNLQPGPARLYNLPEDPGETQDRAAEFPEIVAQLQRLASEVRHDLGDQKRPGANVRPHGYYENPQPLILQE